MLRWVDSSTLYEFLKWDFTNSWLEIIESQDFETHLILERVLAESLVKISQRSSSGRSEGPVGGRPLCPPSIRRSWFPETAQEGSPGMGRCGFAIGGFWRWKCSRIRWVVKNLVDYLFFLFFSFNLLEDYWEIFWNNYCSIFSANLWDKKIIEKYILYY